MKRRLALVSNSSSSSFMYSFGKIIDQEKFDSWCKKQGLDFHTVSGKELATAPTHRLYDDELGTFLSQVEDDFFDYAISEKEMQKFALKDPNATYVMAGSCGMGEDDFYWNGNEYDYDRVDEDEFPKEVEALYGAGQEQGFQIIHWCVYAGRNG